MNNKLIKLTKREIIEINGGSEASEGLFHWAGWMYEGIKSNLSKFYEGLTTVGTWYR